MEIEDFRKKLAELREAVVFSEYCYPERKAQVLCETYVKSDRLAFDIELAWMKTVETYNNNDWRELFYEASKFMGDTMLKAEDANEIVRQIRISKQKKYTIKKRKARAGE